MVAKAKQKSMLRHQRKLNHSIPDIVLLQVKSLKFVRYRALLESFATEYYKTNFPGPRDEFRFIIKYEEALVSHCTDARLFNELHGLMDEDLAALGAARMLEKSYRNHFAHSFQDFLTGTVVIDKFYETFVKWYSPNLNANLRSSVESSWLLTTILHDRYRPVSKYGDMIRRGLTIRPPRVEDHPLIAKRLASMYRHLQSGNSLENWVIDGSNTDPLVDILLKHADCDNHAICAALSLPYYDLQIDDPTLYASALAIALHNSQPREDLLAAKVFPVCMERFPLVALLSYIDAVQEWDRSEDSNDTLIDIRFDNNEVLFEVSFDSPKAARGKAEELEKVSACIVHPSPIRLGFVSKVLVA